MLNIFNIQRYSLHDGDGIRTNIFFKGCPLKCLWCSNPEGIDPAPALMFDERLCMQFGDCTLTGDGLFTVSNGSMIINREKISDLSPYRNICPSKAISIAGEEISVSELIDEIEKDMPFYRGDEGGVTLSGGEPFMQDEDLEILLIGLKKRGINIAIETSLHVPWSKIEPYTGYIDVFLADLKHTDPVKFRENTGGDLSLVMKNFRKLDAAGAKFIVRVPIVPQFNMSVPELQSITDFAASLSNTTGIDYIPYHSLAREKYLMLGKDYPYSQYRNVTTEELLPIAGYAEKKGLKAKIVK